MRPGISLEPGELRPCKSTHTDPTNVPSDRYNASPTTFFLARESDTFGQPLERHDSCQSNSSPLTTLQDAIDETESKFKQSDVLKRSGSDGRSCSRRRSTIKLSSNERLRRNSQNTKSDPVGRNMDRCSTPSPLPSHDVSLPSTPKSLSSYGPLKSDDDNLYDDNNSQVITSSDDGAEGSHSLVQDSQPELIMPSIKMPSRRPFTTRGKRLGRFKILIAGRKSRL